MEIKFYESGCDGISGFDVIQRLAKNRQGGRVPTTYHRNMDRSQVSQITCKMGHSEVALNKRMPTCMGLCHYTFAKHDRIID